MKPFEVTTLLEKLAGFWSVYHKGANIMNITNSVYALIGGFLLDMLLGDPHTPWHPACIIGKYICGYEENIKENTS